MSNSNIQLLNAAGQSIWYDNLSRDVLESGELTGLIKQGVTGLTSNPTIFQKAISGSDKYDTQIKALLSNSNDANLICEELMVQDVGAAADLLLPCYQASQAKDGYASIEVSPFLADDTAGTIAAAKQLWAKLKRPNIMIKIPATAAGIPAIKSVLAAGINVNVTLIFSVAVYQQVAEAYLQALEERVQQNQSIDKLASVASFFVSRVDTICEKDLQKLNSAQATELIGKIGIANSIAAYRAYQDIFIKADRFNKLKHVSPQVQRPLWASTGTKNPEYDPLLYVKNLGLHDTVNTLPPATLNSLLAASNMHLTLPSPAIADSQLAQLKSFNVDLDRLLVELQVQGVKAFADSFTDLLTATKQKITKLA